MWRVLSEELYAHDLDLSKGHVTGLDTSMRLLHSTKKRSFFIVYIKSFNCIHATFIGRVLGTAMFKLSQCQ